VNTANLGLFSYVFFSDDRFRTHTFFLIVLPVIHWVGIPSLTCRYDLILLEFLNGSLVDILAPGVFFTGMVKDFLCLPRPLSPPLQRITMSGSAALEYGFPSTHSANAVSVALYCLTLLDASDSGASGWKYCLKGVAWLYAFSVVMGRIYCGMHGFIGQPHPTII